MVEYFRDMKWFSGSISVLIISSVLITGCSKNKPETIITPPPPPPKDTVLKISNLLYSPHTIPIKPYEPTFSITGTVDFSGARGGVAKIRLTTSFGTDTTIAVQGGSEVTSGTITGLFEFIRPTSTQNHTFQIWLIDTKENASNKLSGSISVDFDESAEKWWPIRGNSDPTFNAMNKVSWLNDQYIAVGVSGRVETSADGSKWTSQRTGTDFNEISFNAVTWESSEYYVAGERNSILSSNDGINWTKKRVGIITDGYFTSIAGSGTVLVAVGNMGGYYAPSFPEISSSSDGSNWTGNLFSLPIFGGMLRSVIWSGNQFVAVGQGRDGDHDYLLILTSKDGLVWTDRSIHSPWVALSDVIWTGTQFVAVGGNTIATSADGITWNVTQPGSLTGARSVVYNGKRYVVAGDAGVYVSDDLVTWHQTFPIYPMYRGLKSIAWSEINHNYVAVGQDFDRYIISP